VTRTQKRYFELVDKEELHGDYFFGHNFNTEFLALRAAMINFADEFRFKVVTEFDVEKNIMGVFYRPGIWNYPMT